MRSGLREIAVVSLLISIPLGTWWYVVRPRNARAEQIRQAIKAKQDELKALDGTQAAIGDLKREITELSEGMAFLESRLPSETEIDKVLHSLWQLAKASALVTKSIRAGDRRKPGVASLRGPHCDQPIAMQLEGDFMRFYAFLQALESQPRLMRIRTMKITRVPDAAEGCIRAEFTMSVFFEKGDS